MTPEENAQDRELLERYRRASDTLDGAPSAAVRAAILAEGRRVAEQRATEQRAIGQPAAEAPRREFDVSRPAANDARWKITAFGTAGAALVAALLFAPRFWESGPVAPATVSRAPSAAVPRDQSSGENAGAPKLESLAPERRQIEEIAASAAPSEKSYAQNYAPAAPPAAAPAAGASSRASAARAAPISSLNAQRAARADTTSAPTALLSAAASGDMAQTTLLLDQGAAPDARDELGRTPLMLAVMGNRLDVARLLLDHGADPNVPDNTGRTPLQQAKRAHLGEMAATLERAGAR